MITQLGSIEILVLSRNISVKLFENSIFIYFSSLKEIPKRIQKLKKNISVVF